MISEKARAAVVWSGLDTFIRQGFGFVISVILARLLLPEDFGTVALLALFLGLAGLFVHAGLGNALVQRQDITHTDESTVFWFNLLVALAMMLLLFGIAPLIAEFFGIAALAPLTMLMAVNIPIGALGIVHGALMAKRLDFKTPMKVGVASSLVSGLVAVAMAWAGHGFWALAGQAIAGSVVTVVLLWALDRWRPLWVLSGASFRKLFGFSSWLYLSGLLDVVYQRGYTLLIGKFYGTRDLGIYNRADNVQGLATGLITDTVSKVAFPLFSSVNQEPERLRNGMRMAVRSMMLITAPCMMGLAVLAGPFIQVVFGDKWLEAAPILQVLCLTGLLYPLHVINLNVLQAQGHTKLFFKLELVKKSVGILLLIGGSWFGLIGIALGRAIGSIFALFVNSYYTKQLLSYGMAGQIKDSAMSLFLAVVMAGIVYMVEDRMQAIGALALFLLIVCGAVIYWILNFVSRSLAYRQAWSLLFGQVKNTA